MIEYYKTDAQGQLQPVEQPTKGGWICAIAPDASEQEVLMEQFGVLPEFLKAALDEEESSYIDRDEEENQTLVIVDYPEQESARRQDIDLYVTYPIGVIFVREWIITICSRDNSTVQQLRQGKVKNLDTRYKTRFLLTMLLLISQEYLADLRLINKLSNQTEQKLYRSMHNRELINMLNLDKSLVYFSTSLKAEELTLGRIARSREIPMYEADRDLLDDVLIEIRQGIEMCQIYMDINARTSDGFSNVINNNMNTIMKRLTVLTLVLSIPNMVYGFYGMNVSDLPWPFAWFPLLLSVLISLAAWIYFMHNADYRG